MERPPRGCCFCGSEAPLSNEHVWPDWISRLVSPEMRGRNVDYSFDDSRYGRVRSVSAPLFQLKVKSVCKRCNNGWMSQQEDAVKPFIEGMLLGAGKELHPGGQLAIARWGTLKALVAHQLSRDQDPYGRVPDEHYRELYACRDEEELPGSTVVYTAKAAWSSGGAQPGFYRLRGIVLGGGGPDRQDGYLLTFSVLDLVVQVHRLFDDQPARFRHPAKLAPSVRQLWPSSGKSFVWPPGPALNRRDLMELAGGHVETEAGRLV